METKEASTGVYVHFPWCLRKCPYCDFVSFAVEREEIDHVGYADAVLAELDSRRAQLEGRRLDTVFVGGGTPSLFEPRQLGRVLGALDLADGAEITVECNPSSLDAERARALAGEGVTRFSVGVQGLDRDRLAFLGRLHDGEGGLAAVRAALSSGAAVSADLIYGVATETPEDAAAEARRVAELGLDHVSAYALTIEPNTAFGARARQKKLPLLTDALVAESFLAVGEALEQAGLPRYEISNHARPGAECRHNLGYWRGRDYLALGCAAVGTLSQPDGTAVRYRNAPNVDRYLSRARAGDFTPHEREVLPPETRLRERIMLGLRLAEGLDLEAAAAELGVDPWPRARREEASRLQDDGRLVIDGGHLRIPARHWLFADGIAASLF